MSGFMLSSATEIERRGHRVSFWFRDRLAPARVSSPGFRRLLVPWLIAAKVIAAARRGERFDVVEIHEPLSAVYGLVARLAGSRLPVCVALSHGLEERAWQAHHAHVRTYGRRVPLRSRILVPTTLLSQARLGLRTAGAVLVVSSADRDYLITRIGVPPERVGCSFGGVTERLFEVKPTVSAQARFLFLGSWTERKGILELTAAWRRLVADRPNVRLTIAGVGDVERARADTRDVPGVDVISAVGRDNLPRLLAEHDVFVLPSWFEGMPLAMLEAAAAGLACVVCAVCGNLDVFRPNDPQRDGAMLVRPSDADALHASLIALADNVDLRRTLGARARERASEFTWGGNAERTLATYVAAIERRRVARRG